MIPNWNQEHCTCWIQYSSLTSRKLAGDQNNNLQSGASNRKGRSLVSRLIQFSTRQHLLDLIQVYTHSTTLWHTYLLLIFSCACCSCSRRNSFHNLHIQRCIIKGGGGQATCRCKRHWCTYLYSVNVIETMSTFPYAKLSFNSKSLWVQLSKSHAVTIFIIISAYSRNGEWDNQM